MAKKQGTAYKVKKIDRYGADVAVYQLSKQFKKAKYLVVSMPRVVSGRSPITMWSADEDGKILDNVPVYVSKGTTIKDAFLEIDFTT